MGTQQHARFFRRCVQWGDLSAKDKKCKYLMQNIHKLPFVVPRDVKPSEVSPLESIVTSFYPEVKLYESSVMAYKGGHYERDLLASLAIPAVNLENFGCQKAGELFDELIWLETCGNHTVK